MRWRDKRLGYGAMNLTEINRYHMTHWIDLDTSKDNFWRPSISYLDEQDTIINQDEMYLLQDGT